MAETTTGKILPVYDNEGNLAFPQTHEDAIRTNDDKTLGRKFTELNDKIDGNISRTAVLESDFVALEKTQTEISTITVPGIQGQLDNKAKQVDLEVERKRIDGFTTLAQGSTTGDAELIDGRVGEDGLTYNNLGSSIRNQFSNLPFDSTSVNKVIDVTPIWTSGTFDSSGGIGTNTQYKYTQKILVKTGDVITVYSKTTGGTITTNTPMRFLCAYNGSTIVSASGSNTAVTTYTVPSNINNIVITCDTTNYNSHIVKINGTRIVKTLSASGYGNLGTRVTKIESDIASFNSKLDNLPFDEITETKEVTENIAPTFTSGYINESGVVNSSSTYSYSQKISVKEGDVITLSWKLSNGTQQTGTMRFICAYNGSNSVSSSGITSGATSYTVPSGIDGVIVSCDTVNYNSHVIVKKTLQSTIKLTVTDQEFLISKVIGSPIITGSASTLTTGSVLELEENSISKNKYLSFSCDITSLGNGIIRLGHGKTTYNASYIEITNTNLTIYKYSYMLETMKTVAHGLTLSNYIKVNIKVGADNKVQITLFTSTGSYTLKDVYWTGRSGKIFAEVQNCTATNVKMNWYSDDYKKSIYAFGDSYFEVTGNNRWTAYLIADGYDNLLLDHYSGRKSQVAYQSFLKALEHGTPKYALWCMGMNDPDSDTAINPEWKTATDNFIARCVEKKITPILCTIPNVKGGAVDDTDIANMRLHNFKNAYVKNSGYRYIDFYKAVGADNVNWYANMLYSDGVHPDVLGAEALYRQALVDFPELMVK